VTSEQSGPPNAVPSVLLIGPTQERGASETNVLGGNVIMMGEQQRELAARGLRLGTVDTSGPVTNLHPVVLMLMGALRFIRVMRQVNRRIKAFEVVCSMQRSRRLWDIGAAMWLLCKLRRRPLVLRVTGGRLARRYAEGGRVWRWIADHTFMRSDIVYVETRAVLDNLPARSNLRYFPNTRQLPDHAQRERTEVRKLLFLSRIEPDKGLHECLQACKNLPESCSLSIYGAPTSGADMTEVKNCPSAVYHGVADPEEIPGILAEHDLMLFPTYFAGEGLAGVVLEALQAGMPVISTRIGGLPELIDHEVNGLLVEPRSVAELEQAIKRLLDDPALYRRLCASAKQRGDEFRSDRWYDSFAADLSRLAEQSRQRQSSVGPSHDPMSSTPHAEQDPAGLIGAPERPS